MRASSSGLAPSLARQHAPRLAIAALGTAISIFGLLTGPLLLLLVTNALVRQRGSEAAWWVALMLVGALLKASGSCVAQLQLGRVACEVAHDLRERFFLQSLQAGPERDDDDLDRLHGDLGTVCELIHPGLVRVLSASLCFLGSLLLMAFLDLRLTLVVLVTLGPASWLAFNYSQRACQHFRRGQAAYQAMLGAARENLRSMRVVRAYVQEEQQQALFTRRAAEVVASTLAEIRTWCRYDLRLQLLLGLNALIVMGLGAFEVASGRLSLGGYVAFNTYLLLLSGPLDTGGDLASRMRRGLAGLRGLTQVSEPPAAAALAAVPQRGTPGLALEVRNLSFASHGQPLLEDFSLSLRPGEVVGLLGPTGCGKTTLINLLTRIIEPPPGTVFVGEQSVGSRPLSELRAHLGVVSQQGFVISGSIRENLTWGSPGASPQKLEAALRLAGCERDVQRFRDGLETPVGERGIKLSGGQRQRLCLARVLVRGTPVLLLDDCLSNVDLATETEILQGLLAQAGRPAMLLISHRVSTVRFASRILLMDGGRIAAEGTHSQLVAKNPLYAALWRQQVSGAD